jgi:hypothetical protein
LALTIFGRQSIRYFIGAGHRFSEARSIMRLRKLTALASGFLLTFGVASTVLATAPTGHQVTICHATDSNSHPYVTDTVDISSSGDLSGGHSKHTGPLWDGQVKKWGDIIPPYDYTNDSGTFHFDGLNWTEDGQAIYNNGCKVPEEAPHNPAINVDKTADPTTLPAGGGDVTYTYVVTNTGDVPLSNVTVSDNKCSPVAYQGGDTNDDQLLDLTESWTFTCSATLTDTTTNTATATGHDGDTTVSATDAATVTVQPVVPPNTPGIHVEKTASVENLPVGGGSVTYTYVVTNTGDVPLTGITVTDNKCAPVAFGSGDTNDDQILDKAETWTYTCTTTITASTTNTAVATGHDGETTVTDTDDATVPVATPGGGVQAETNVPTPPATDIASGSVTSSPSGSIPFLLIILGVIGFAAVALMPVRNRR